MFDTSVLETKTDLAPTETAPVETGSEEVLFKEALTFEPSLIGPAASYISEMKRHFEGVHKFAEDSHISSELQPPYGITLESRMEDMVQAEIVQLIASRHPDFLQKASLQVDMHHQQAVRNLCDLLETLFPLPNGEDNLAARLYWVSAVESATDLIKVSLFPDEFAAIPRVIKTDLSDYTNMHLGIYRPTISSGDDNAFDNQVTAILANHGISYTHLLPDELFEKWSQQEGTTAPLK